MSMTTSQFSIFSFMCLLKWSSKDLQVKLFVDRCWSKGYKTSLSFILQMINKQCLDEIEQCASENTEY